MKEGGNLDGLINDNKLTQCLIFLQEEILETCRKNVECLEAILRTESGDPKILKGERPKITIIIFNQCNCMKITHFISFWFMIALNSSVVNFIFGNLRKFCNSLGSSRRSAELFCTRFVRRLLS